MARTKLSRSGRAALIHELEVECAEALVVMYEQECLVSRAKHEQAEAAKKYAGALVDAVRTLKESDAA